MVRVFRAAILIMALGASALMAQEPDFRVRVGVSATAPKDERWLELRSKNFHVIGNVDETRLRRTAADLELLRERFAEFFPAAAQVSTVSTTVVALRDKESLAPYLRLKDAQPDDSTGYFQPGSDVHYLVLGSDTPNRAIYRDYIRSRMPDSFGLVPTWFQLGLAEYFTTFKVTWSDSYRWIEIGGRDKQFNDLLKDNTVIPFTSFLVNVPEAADRPESRDTTYYAQSWAFTHYLLQGGMLRLQQAMQFFQSIAEGHPFDQSFAGAFGMDMKTFEGESDADADGTGFRVYVREARVGKFIPDAKFEQYPRTWGGWLVNLSGYSLSPNLSSIRTWFFTSELCRAANALAWYPCTHLVNIPVNQDPTWAHVRQRPVRLMSEAETHAHRGNLMLHIDRRDEAEEFLQIALRIDPDLAPARAALGHLRLLQGRNEDARRELRRAAELNPDDYLTHYYTALLLKKQAELSTAPDELVLAARSELKRTLTLAPHFVEAAEVLADMNARRVEDLDDSIKVMRDALNRSPGRQSLLLGMARVLAANRNAQEAGRLLNRVDVAAKMEISLRDAVREVRDYLNQLPAEREAVQQFFGADSEPSQESVEVRGGVDDAPEGVLVRLNPPAVPSGQKIQGKLTAMECAADVVFTLQGADGRVVKLRSATPEKIEFLRHTTSVNSTISCGTFPGLLVTITYRPLDNSPFLGEPLRIEFADTFEGR